MPALGQTETSGGRIGMSGIPPIATELRACWIGSFVPDSEISNRPISMLITARM